MLGALLGFVGKYKIGSVTNFMSAAVVQSLPIRMRTVRIDFQHFKCCHYLTIRKSKKYNSATVLKAAHEQS
jgi:hypothetical protein